MGVVGQYAALQANPKFYEVLDVARRIAGTGSLGVERYAIPWLRAKDRPTGTMCWT